MYKLIMITLLFTVSCVGEPQCNELVEEFYLDCADAVVEFEVDQCSIECEIALEQSTCDSFKVAVNDAC